MPLPLFNSDPNQDQSLPVATGNDATGLPLQRVYITPPQADVPEGPIDNYSSGTIDVTDTKESILDKLLGTNGQDRYQLWPEKLVRDALAAPHDAMNTTTPVTSEDLIKPALDVSALAGTGGLGGAGEEAGATLGAGPFLRPALKYEGKIYKAPMGGQHMDAIPKDLQPEFTRQAMNGEDISNFDFGFMNHKGQFLDREKALQYAIDNGLLSPHDAKFGALTSTMQLSADSSKPATALDLASKSRQELERMPIDDLDRAAYGHAEGDLVTSHPKDIKIIHKGDMANPEDKFKKGGMNWVKSVDRSEPVDVSINQAGQFTLEDGHHRYFAAKKLNEPLQAKLERIKGKPIEKILNSDLHNKLVKDQK